MDGLGTVEGNTEANTQLAEKVEPLGRDKGAICLERVCGDNAAAQDSSRLGYKTAEEFLAGQERHPPVEDERDLVEVFVYAIRSHSREQGRHGLGGHPGGLGPIALVAHV